MDQWELFCHLCKTVVDEQNVFLDILITSRGIEMMLMPMDEEDIEEQ